MIPEVVGGDEKLPTGARLLWGLIRKCSFQEGVCYASDETLARLLKVSVRQLIRYLRVLESAGLLRSTPRPGKTPIRELLFESRFDGKVGVRSDTNVRGGGHKCQGGVTDPSVLYKEEGLLKGLLNGKAGGDQKTVSPKQSALATSKPVRAMTEEEYRARGRERRWPEHIIERDIERFRERARNAKAERLLKASELTPELAGKVQP